MKSFCFKQFEINQSKKVFRVGTDAVVLGACANISNIENVLEVGTGTGIISLMLAQRSLKTKITAIDIDENAADLARTNFQNSPFSERLNVVCEDFNLFKTQQKFDLIISNPPYFEENQSSKDVLARQKVKLNFKQLINTSCQLLSTKGRLSIIIPFTFEAELENLAKEEGLFLNHRLNIYGIKDGDLKRCILTFSKEKTTFEEEDFVIEKSPRQYSDQYLEHTKAFHVFSK